ncbi:MAG: hypothetical protein ACE5GA_02255 [Candidatus Zixiibacteriota bacterium]
MNYYLILAVALVAVLFYFVPQLLRVRIAVLRKLHLIWFAELHEKHFSGWVVAIRIVLAASAVALLYFALR